MRQSFLLIACVVFFIACSNDVAPQINYPQWYIDGSNDTRFLYGYGESNSLKDAKARALEDLAQGISLTLESSLNVKKELKNDEVSSEIKSDIGISVDSIELDSAEFSIIDEVDGIFFVQVRLEKSKLIDKINNDINNIAIPIKNILNEVRDSGCNVISPRDKYTLQGLFDEANNNAKKIYALDGKVTQENLLKSTQLMLSFPSNALYEAYARGGSSKEYSLLNNAFMSEYAKFFKLHSQDSTLKELFKIESNYVLNGREVNLITNIKDCNGAVIFEANLKAESAQINSSISRLKAQLYKKLNAWVISK